MCTKHLKRNILVKLLELKKKVGAKERVHPSKKAQPSQVLLEICALSKHLTTTARKRSFLKGKDIQLK